MSVSRVFEGDDRFKGVAMRVMLALVPFADENIIMEKAAELAAEGNLDTNAVNALIEPKKEPKAETVQSKAEPVKPQENATEAAESQETQAPQVVPPAGEPGTDESAPWEEESKLEAPKAAPLDNTANTENSAMAGLLAQIKALTEQLQAANDRIASLTSARESKKAAAPMLPQFKSSCFYARLGLSAEEATKKTAVNKAKRELVKLGYGEGHGAWALISEAVEELTK